MRVVRFSEGVLLGALVGGGLVLLLTPRTGERTRALVRDWLQTVWREGQQAAETKRSELVARLAEMQTAGQ